jgi:hypothetical protein
MDPNHYMKHAILLIFFFITLALGCTKESTYRSKGEITGADARMCVCCGGWFIKIDSTTYLASTLPSDFKYDFTNAVYPIPVKLNWETKQNACTGFNLITVTSIALDP